MLQVSVSDFNLRISTNCLIDLSEELVSLLSLSPQINNVISTGDVVSFSLTNVPDFSVSLELEYGFVKYFKVKIKDVTNKISIKSDNVNCASAVLKELCFYIIQDKGGLFWLAPNLETEFMELLISITKNIKN